MRAIFYHAAADAKSAVKASTSARGGCALAMAGAPSLTSLAMLAMAVLAMAFRRQRGGGAR